MAEELGSTLASRPCSTVRSDEATEGDVRHMILVGALAGVLTTAPAWAQANKEDKSTEAGAHSAPRPQPATAPTPTVPTGEVALGTFRIPKAVKADGKTLPAGTYQIRVTPQP